MAVIDAYKRKRKIIEEKWGPVLLDVLTYRFSGHSPSDASSYRSKEEVEAWQAVDSIIWFGSELVKAGIATEAELESMKAATTDLISWGVKLAIDPAVSVITSYSIHYTKLYDFCVDTHKIKSRK